MTRDPYGEWPSTSGCTNPPEESCSDAACPIHGPDYADQVAHEDFCEDLYWDTFGHGGAQ